MEKEEILKKLYDGEKISNKEIFDIVNPYFTPSNLKLLLRKFCAMANLLEYDYLKAGGVNAVTQIDFGKVSAIFDLIQWAFFYSNGIKKDIAYISWSREIADFITETPETIKSIK